MIGKIFGLLCAVSLLISFFTGNCSQLGTAVFDGASKAVTLTISLIGIMGFWNGVMKVAQKSGFIKKAEKLLSPILKYLFPDAYKKKNGLGEISAAMCANIFGIGNASTPLALSAMKKLKENSGESDVASNDMMMFTLLACSPFSLFPTTVIALRKSAGSAEPFKILIPVWICSLICSFLAVLLVKGIPSERKKRK